MFFKDFDFLKKMRYFVHLSKFKCFFLLKL